VRADAQELGDEGCWVVGDPVAHDDLAAGFGDADEFFGYVEGLGGEHCAEDCEGKVKGVIGDAFEQAGVALLEFQVCEVCGGGSLIACFDEVGCDVDAEDVVALLG
jgi:hypothetical protein